MVKNDHVLRDLKKNQKFLLGNVEVKKLTSQIL